MKRMLPWIIVILLAITLIVGAAFILWNSFMKESMPSNPKEAAQAQAERVQAEQISAEELAKMTFSIDDVVTNLSDPSYFINASFTFELDSVKSKEEFELLHYKMRDVINTTLNDMTADEVRGSNGLAKISAELLNRTNALLNKGKVRQVYVTKYIVTYQ